MPNKFFRTDYGEGLRIVLSEQSAVSRIVDFGVSQVFPASTYTCLLFLSKGNGGSFEHSESEASVSALADLRLAQRPKESLTNSIWTFESSAVNSLLTRIFEGTVRLLELPAEMSRGVSTGDDDVFVFDSLGLDLEGEILRQPLFANDFTRYRYAPSGKWRIIFPYVLEDGKYRLYSEAELKSEFPRTWSHLLSRKAILLKRKQYQQWYGYSAPRNLALHDRAHILVPLLANRGLCARLPVTMQRKLCPMAGGGFTLTLSAECRLNPAYILGLLNSTLLFWCLTKTSNLFRGGWITCTKQYFGELPIKVADLSLTKDKSSHDQIVALVDRMQDLNKRLLSGKTDHERALIERQIAATDKEIDRLVYDLYALTNQEIQIVEGGASGW